jgi:hypothetical protein
MTKTKCIEINTGFALNMDGSGAKGRVSLTAQYIMRNTARNTFPSNGTVEIAGLSLQGIIRHGKVISHRSIFIVFVRECREIRERRETCNVRLCGVCYGITTKALIAMCNLGRHMSSVRSAAAG